MSDEPMTGIPLKLHQIRARIENGHGADFVRWMRDRPEEEIDSLHAFLHPEPSDAQKEELLEQAARIALQAGESGLAETIRGKKPKEQVDGRDK